MGQVWIALDVETTGLNPERDEIIEIAAVAFDEHGIREEWSTLVRPRRGLPQHITRLTGITPEMVAQAPFFDHVREALLRFVGNAPLVGHNLHRFDLPFLQQYGLFRRHPQTLDTYDLAAILLPTAPRYTLDALAQHLGLPIDTHHRALADARLTAQVFLHLLERARELPEALLRSIIEMGHDLHWPNVAFFRAAQPGVARRWTIALPVGPLPEARRKDEHIRPVPEEAIHHAFSPRGALGQALGPAYEQRTEQIEMAHAVTDALNQGYHLLVEAGTGTGKSMAYLVPALLFAARNPGHPIVISTYTRTLQDQLVQHDIPTALDALGLRDRVSVAVLKGRRNYLCPRRLQDMLRRGPANDLEARVLFKVLVWLDQGGTGDRSELNLNRHEEAVWSKLSAEDEGCTSNTCLQRMNGICPFYRARQAALRASIVVVNHALLLSDVVTGSRLLPEFDHLIVDEAHHLEAAATDAHHQQVGVPSVRRLVAEVGDRRRGALGHFLHLMRGVLVQHPQAFAALSRAVDNIAASLFQFHELLQRLFIILDDFMQEQLAGQRASRYAQQLRLTPAMRSQPMWSRVEAQWDDARAILNDATSELRRVLNDTREDAAQEETLHDAHQRLQTLLRDLTDLRTALDAMLFEPQENMVYWLEKQPAGTHTLTLNAAPLHIGPLMETHFWRKRRSVILTSATLSVNGSFDYIRERLWAWDAEVLALGSPFDYESAALLYVVNNIPEPQHPNYPVLLERALAALARATRGRMMVLFTSYAQLERTARALERALAPEGILVLRQGEGSSPASLIQAFRAAEAAVLLGTRSFWEGVDIPGEDLSVLAIAKLPFAVPSDPLVAARAEMYDNPFWEYYLPDAILTFRQGFGRLIRSRSDRGIAVVLDARVLTRSYGRYFIQSLPPASVRIGPWQELPRAAAQWLGM